MGHKNCTPGGAPPSSGLRVRASGDARGASIGARRALSREVAW